MNIEHDPKQRTLFDFSNLFKQPTNSSGLNLFGSNQVSSSPRLNLFGSNQTSSSPKHIEPERSYQLNLHEMQHRDFGRDALQKVGDDFTSKNFGSAWREKATPNEYGGSGMDEKTSTATTRKFLDKIDQNPNLTSSQRSDVAANLSMNRISTDALVWHKDGEYHGHPGALRYEAKTTQWASKGHWTKDMERAQTARTEFDALSNDFTTADRNTVVKAVWNANLRTSAETIRTMSMPYEQFQAIGRTQTEVYHSKFGDISQSKQFDAMASYVHDTREAEKWATGAQMNMRGFQDHVPSVMQAYLTHHNNDHYAAREDFRHSVSQGLETRINTATSSQADPLDSHETLEGTTGRKRALSNPRMFRK